MSSFTVVLTAIDRCRDTSLRATAGARHGTWLARTCPDGAEARYSSGVRRAASFAFSDASIGIVAEIFTKCRSSSSKR